ncbi:threonine synthase [Candidatus Formimonas warabiya]|uniref:Threonine synthase n=1 Tax=Formimonas warabiya TaxID=1761012 RepID=A0A3G1KQV2_FORW1|nr:threonine synthase [Candidatus Formimonas warabiya]ATW24838.1 threonine synthase [Candidatus Formimonas warabiya]
MENVKGLQCISCGRVFPADDRVFTCPECGEKGILDVIYDYDYIKKNISRETLSQNRDYSIWRYLPFLPVQKESRRTPLKVGWTPLYYPQKLMEVLGLSRLFLKDDGLNPTASLKDRASAIAVVKAGEEGFETVACSSTGNAASSLAGNAAAMGLKSVIFVPQRAPQGKVAQLLIFGATVISVQGNYEDAFHLSAQAIAHWGWYNRNAAINPYLVEGKKTVTLEICEQLNWQVPDWAIFSVGDGCTIAGAWKGFKDLYQAGFIDKLPKMAGVQAEGCCPITRAFLSGNPLEPMEENTLADSIAVGVPRNPDKALNAIRESKGTMINVTDEEILQAMKLLGHTCGVFGEPAGVTGLAGLKKLVAGGLISRDELVVTCITGNGLKDVNNAVKAAGAPIKVDPDLGELKKKLAGLVRF